jgi:hypothetical protein
MKNLFKCVAVASTALALSAVGCSRRDTTRTNEPSNVVGTTPDWGSPPANPSGAEPGGFIKFDENDKRELQNPQGTTQGTGYQGNRSGVNNSSTTTNNNMRRDQPSNRAHDSGTRYDLGTTPR